MNRYWKADILLLITAMVWGFAFVAQRAGMEHIGPFLFNGIRFLLGGLLLVPFAMRRRGPVPGTGPEHLPVRWAGRTGFLLAGTLCGIVLLGGASLQQVGMVYTSAANGGFITGLYVVFVPFLGVLLHIRKERRANSGASLPPAGFWRRHLPSSAAPRPDAGTWVGAGLCVVGLYFLSVRGDFTLAPGDALVLASTLFWAVHLILIGQFSGWAAPIRLACFQFLFCGVFSLLIAALAEPVVWAGIRGALPALAYGGICSVGIGYTLQVIAQKDAHPAHAAILLSLESVFAAVGGVLALHESLAARELFGCALMFAGMLAAQLWPKGEGRRRAEGRLKAEG